MYGVVTRSAYVFRVLAVCLFLMAPAAALAQSAISGTARDSSGAVLPGVTVEASSSVLIEKVRTVITDSEGRYSIVDLRPGPYVVVFTLAGFSVLRRDRKSTRLNSSHLGISY